MERRNAKLGTRANKRKVGARVRPVVLDEHEGLSTNQVKVILREFGLLDKYDEFNGWMYGQTCPIVYRFDHTYKSEATGNLRPEGGVYEYDLFRWIESKTSGRAPLWD